MLWLKKAEKFKCVSETAIFSKKRQLRIFDKDGKVNKEEKNIKLILVQLTDDY